MDSIKYLNWELGIEFDIASFYMTMGASFDKSFLYFSVKKKIYAKATLNLTVNTEY